MGAQVHLVYCHALSLRTTSWLAVLIVLLRIAIILIRGSIGIVTARQLDGHRRHLYVSDV